MSKTPATAGVLLANVESRVSQPVIQFKTDSGEKDPIIRVNFNENKTMSKTAVGFAEWFMPCHQAQVYMTVLNERANGKHRVFLKDERVSKKDSEEKIKQVADNVTYNWKLKSYVRKIFLCVFSGYVLLGTLVALIGQWWRERQWDGR